MPLMLSLFACGKKEAERTPIEPAPVNIAVGIGKITPQGGVSKLASPVAGIVSDIAVTTGVKVKQGDLLLTLDNTDASLALNEIESRLSTQQKSIASAKVLKEQGVIRLREKERKLKDALELLAAGAEVARTCGVSRTNMIWKNRTWRSCRTTYFFRSRNSGKLRHKGRCGRKIEPYLLACTDGWDSA